MNHLVHGGLAALELADRPNQRALAKQRTREKIVAAAKLLFAERGYEGATIRDIAAAAGMSTGAVFANFSDKSDLFREIMISDLGALAENVREATQKARNVEDVLLKMFSAGYSFYKSQLPLARAAFTVAWSQDEGEVIRNLEPLQAMQQMIVEQLEAAAERGELGQEAEVKLRAQMLYDAYLANYSRAIFEGWSLEALQARARDQIRVILAGARRRG
jgi:AcrR family transcriptional regulator